MVRRATWLTDDAGWCHLLLAAQSQSAMLLAIARGELPRGMA
jgi:hypothetical protein